MKTFVPSTILIISITILFHIPAYTQSELIAHYPFYQDGADSLGMHDDADLENVIFTDSSAYLDGNYYWDDNMGSHLLVGPLSNWDPEHFRLSLNVKIDSLPEATDLPIIVLGSSWRWMHANVTPHGEIELAIDGSGQITSDSIVRIGEWAPLIIERDSTQGTALLIYNDSDTLEVLVEKTNHNNDKRISASHGGSGKTFKGYWRNLKVFNTTDVMTSSLLQPDLDIRIYPNPSTDYLMIENNNNIKLNASLYSVSGRKFHTLEIQPFSAQKFAPNTPTTGIYYLELKNKNQRLSRKIVFH